jgi:multisubunit Na+/H+ antiporter MnhG subunit
MANPLVPSVYDIWWFAALLLALVLLVIALVSIARSSKSLTATRALIWTLVTIFIPVVGPVSWLAIGRNSTLSKHGAASTH